MVQSIPLTGPNLSDNECQEIDMHDQPIFISVVICTYNNAASLTVTLTQILRQDINDLFPIEILIVDNNSSDNTKQEVESFIKSYTGKAYYFREDNQGLSFARNRGIRESRGIYILFTDDDADVPPNWIKNYCTKITESGADCLYSKIKVQWDKPKPWWYSSRFRSFFVELDYGEKPRLIYDIHHEFFGKNFAIKKDEIIALGGFNENLGRKGNSLVAGEETVIYRSLISRGSKVYYFPDAEVGHRLKDREYSEENIRKAFIDGARTRYHLASMYSRLQFRGRPVALPFVAVMNILKYGLLAIHAQFLSRPSDIFFFRLLVIQNYTLLRISVSHA